MRWQKEIGRGIRDSAAYDAVKYVILALLVSVWPAVNGFLHVVGSKPWYWKLNGALIIIAVILLFIALLKLARIGKVQGAVGKEGQQGERQDSATPLPTPSTPPGIVPPTPSETATPTAIVPTPEKVSPKLKTTPFLSPSSSETILTPTQITERIKSASFSDRDAVARAFIGLLVDWTLFFSSAKPLTNHEEFTLAFFEDRDEKDIFPTLVNCSLSTEDHKRLPLMNKTDRFRVRGTIERAAAYQITLKGNASIKLIRDSHLNEKNQTKRV